MNPQISQAIDFLVESKNIDKNVVIEALEAALASAYKRDFGEKEQLVEVDLTQTSPESPFGKITVVHTIVEEYIDPKDIEVDIEDEDAPKPLPLAQQMLLEEAKELDPDVEVGDQIREVVVPSRDFGRIAAMTAKQVLMQRIREFENKSIELMYQNKVGQIISGQVHGREGENVLIQIDKLLCLLPPRDQIPGERYETGAHKSFYVVGIRANNTKRVSVILSRAHPQFVARLMEREVPEILDGTVKIEKVAREAGTRTKVAVSSTLPNFDPVGACVGQAGTRIQSIISELNGELIDVLLWDENPAKLIEKALAPATLHAIDVDEENKRAKIYLEEDQRSLAIGKGGQNVRLAGYLSGWEIDILNMEAFRTTQKDTSETPAGEQPAKKRVSRKKAETTESEDAA